MRFLQLQPQVVIYLFLVLFNIGLAKNRQLGPNVLLEASNITKNEESANSGPSTNHGFQNRRYPSSLSCFSNCPFRQGVVFLGGPCGPMKATCCGGFGCASGIGFPISTVCCKLFFVFFTPVNKLLHFIVTLHDNCTIEGKYAKKLTITQTRNISFHREQFQVRVIQEQNFP